MNPPWEVCPNVDRIQYALLLRAGDLVFRLTLPTEAARIVPLTIGRGMPVLRILAEEARVIPFRRTTFVS